jgi:hypothetical protein
MSKSIRKLIIFTIPLLVAGFIVSTLYKWNYIQHRQYIPDEFNIPYLTSGADFNKNRVDDAKEILQGAKDYMGKNPKYEPLREYGNGWPDGSYGSNGDVIARALERAGYDLKTYINQDVEKNPSLYEGIAAGTNIAFRNPAAQFVFFSRYAEPHSTDIYNKTEWQAGDIIFFEKNHCAIVADKVNENGVRFIIHHFWGYQGGWFQDVLEIGAWGKVIGHFRITERIASPKTDFTSVRNRVQE